MSFPYGPGTWVPHTASEHAYDILNELNATLKTNNVLDANGNVVQLAAVASDAAWLLILAVGAIRAGDDQALLAAAQMFSIAECSDQQISEVLPMAGTGLIPAAASTAVLTVVADSTGATVAAGSKAPYGTVCNFVVLQTTVIAANGTAQILAQSDVNGAIAVPPGALSSFSPTVVHVVSVTNAAAAVVGRDVETYGQVRRRLLAGEIEDMSLNGTQNAIGSVAGIILARVYLNTSPTVALLLQGGMSIPPQRAYVVIQGVDITGTAIAAAYAQRMLVDTFSVGLTSAPAPYTRTDISFSAVDNSVNTAAGDFVAAGFASGQWVQFTDGNSGAADDKIIGLVGTVTVAKMVLTQCMVVTESATGSVTVTAKNVQPYTTAAGQLIPVQFDYAVNQTVYVKVLYELGSATATGFDTAIKNTVTLIQWTIGAHVTAAAVMQALAGFAYATITSAQISSDGITWATEVLVNGNAVPYITAANVTVING